MIGFTTRNEAIDRQIVEAINGSGEVQDARAEYDIDAIADTVLGGWETGYLMLPEYGGLTGDPEVDADAQANAENFWTVVANHARDAASE